MNTIKSFSVDDIKGLSIESQIDIYNNKYQLNKSSIHIKGLATCQGSLCPCTITQGTAKTLTTSASSGTPPYSYHWAITKPDSTIDTAPTQDSISYTFNQLGNYNISVYITDSCPSGSKTSNTESCTINVIPVSGTGYNCISPGNCQPAPAGTTGQYPDLASCNIGCPIIISGCPPDCDLTKNYCIAGACIPKTYAVYAGVGFGALFLLALIK